MHAPYCGARNRPTSEIAGQAAALVMRRRTLDVGDRRRRSRRWLPMLVAVANSFHWPSVPGVQGEAVDALPERQILAHAHHVERDGLAQVEHQFAGGRGIVGGPVGVAVAVDHVARRELRVVAAGVAGRGLCAARPGRWRRWRRGFAATRAAP